MEPGDDDLFVQDGHVQKEKDENDRRLDSAGVGLVRPKISAAVECPQHLDEGGGGSGPETPGRRSHRSKATVSYADIDDFDSATDGETSPGAEEPVSAASRRTPAGKSRRRGFAASPAARHQRRDPFPSPSVKQHFRERKRGSATKCRLQVNQPAEPTQIQDLSSSSSQTSAAGDSLQPEEEAESQLLSPGAGKYFSVVGRTESPSGTIKIKLNRIVKRRRTLESPSGLEGVTEENAAAVNVGVLSPAVVELPSSSFRMAVPRFSRSKTKDLGISPQELVQFMAAVSPPKVRDLLLYRFINFGPKNLHKMPVQL
jgi:hypothetical protein